MKKVLLFFLLVLITSICKADYETTTLPELIDKSELIVSGRITKVFTGHFEIEVVETVKGKAPINSFKVKKFSDWTCAERWTGYKSGQNLLLFLSRDDKGEWYPLGAGNEGEMPIEQQSVYYKTLYMRIDREPKELRLSHGTIYGYRFDISDALLAMRTYLENKARFGELIKERKLAEYKTDNPFLKRIIDELAETSSWR